MATHANSTTASAFPHVIDIEALEAEFNYLNTRFIERGERAKEARDAFLTKLAETSSTDQKVTQFKARVYTAVWHENYRDGLTWWLEAALEPHMDEVDLSDAMARSICRDVFDQATRPLLVSEQGSIFSYEEMLAVRAAGQGRVVQPATA